MIYSGSAKLSNIGFLLRNPWNPWTLILKKWVSRIPGFFRDSRISRVGV
jgi:hypothetical protein